MSRQSEKMNRLINEEFGGNLTKCARVLGVSPSTISRIANGKTNSGIKVVRKVVGFCDRNNLEHERFIEIR